MCIALWITLFHVFCVLIHSVMFPLLRPVRISGVTCLAGNCRIHTCMVRTFKSYFLLLENKDLTYPDLIYPITLTEPGKQYLMIHHVYDTSRSSFFFSQGENKIISIGAEFKV